MSKNDLMIIFALFVGLIITATLIGSIGDEVNAQTNSRTFVNTTITGPADGVSVFLEGRSLESGTMILRNVSEDVTSEYDLSNRIGSNGLLSVAITGNSTSLSAGELINASYTAIPDGHAVGSGDSSIIKLILIFAAIAQLIFSAALVMKMINESKGIRR